MKIPLTVTRSLPLLIAFSAAGFAADEGSLCTDQAGQIISRLQAEVVGELTTVELASANQIVLEVCQAREKQVEAQVEQVIQQVRDEEQAKADAWLTEPADKPGNKRLKRKSH